LIMIANEMRKKMLKMKANEEVLLKWKNKDGGTGKCALKVTMPAAFGPSFRRFNSDKSKLFVVLPASSGD
jgi:hypothetical protein